MSYPPGQKPPQWSIDPGIVAYNASKMGLPMPVGLWAMWEKGGNTVYDLSGNSNNGTLQAGDYWNDQGIRFTSSYLPVGTFNFDGEFTAIGIMMSATDIADAAIFGASGALQLWRDESAPDRFSVGYLDDGWKVENGTTTPNIVSYYTVGTTHDGTTAKLYVNGQQEGSDLTVSTGGSRACWWGAGDTTASKLLDGWLRLGVLFYSALSKLQMQLFYLNPYGLIADPYQIDTLGYVAAAGGGLSIPIAMHHLTKNVGS